MQQYCTPMYIYIAGEFRMHSTKMVVYGKLWGIIMPQKEFSYWVDLYFGTKWLVNGMVYC